MPEPRLFHLIHHCENHLFNFMVTTGSCGTAVAAAAAFPTPISPAADMSTVKKTYNFGNFYLKEQWGERGVFVPYMEIPGCLEDMRSTDEFASSGECHVHSMFCSEGQWLWISDGSF